MPQSHALSQALAALRTCLHRLEKEQDRYRDAPIYAVGCFLEGVGNRPRHPLGVSDIAAQYLGLPLANVRLAQGERSSIQADITHHGPYFAFLRPEDIVEGMDPGRGVERQIRALVPVFDELGRTLWQLRDEAVASKILPHREAGWWEVLFHFAVHYSEPFLLATRKRWVNVTALATGVDPRNTIQLRYPHEARISEFQFQFGIMQAPFEEVAPSMIWSVLKDDVFTSSVQAVRAIMRTLEEPAQGDSWDDRLASRAAFVELRERFELWARNEAFELQLDSANKFIGGTGRSIQLVKVASSFESPPIQLWTSVLEIKHKQYVRLSQCYADAEYLLYSHQIEEFIRLCEEAGNALLPSMPDGATMFLRQGFVPDLPTRVAWYRTCGFPHFSHEPKARWVRFVFTVSQQANETDLLIHWETDPNHPRQVVEPMYGSAYFKNGFAAACVRAIDWILATLRTSREDDLPPPQAVSIVDQEPLSPNGGNTQREKGNKPRRGHPPIAEKERERRRRLWVDFKAAERSSGLTKAEFVQMRGFFGLGSEKNALTYLEKCRKTAGK